jgi:hypothetical protein
MSNNDHYEDFAPGCLGNIDDLENSWAMFVRAAMKAYDEQEAGIRSDGDCVFTAKIKLQKSGDSFTIIVESQEKFPARKRGAVVAHMTRQGLQIFKPVQETLPGVINLRPKTEEN